MFVVVWEPKRGASGHQLVMDKAKAQQISCNLGRAMPEAKIQVLPAQTYADAAVVERQMRR